VTPEVAGSSPVAPVKLETALARVQPAGTRGKAPANRLMRARYAPVDGKRLAWDAGRAHEHIERPKFPLDALDET
jgi:hypothetical protein